MKKKVRVKSLPKAQVGKEQPPMVLNQNIWGNATQGIKPVTSYETIDSKVFRPITPDMMGMGVPKTKAEWEKKNGPFNLNGDYFRPKKDFGIPTYDPSTPGARMSEDMRNQEQTLKEGEVLSSTPKSILNAQGISNQVNSYINRDQNIDKKGNPYIAPMLLAGTDIFSSIARKIQDRNVTQDFKNQFLADNLYNVRPEDYPGNRGDYNFNEFGYGPSFRPDEYTYGMYNKIAQMGGEMKRKVKITSLPQAGYGGTQDAKAVNQLYGNSAYMMNMFNGATKGEPQEQYGQTLGPDPRSISVLEAEKGETLVRKGTNSTIPEFFTIGGKRHSEGGTPLAGDKATPDSFIYSDTKAMKIKDPAILESFGFAAKKGGYTPAKISKKFDLNNKDLREGLYSDNDPLRKSTAVIMADNYISNLGKLALLQESQKGFPQGIPQIAMPYMDKVGLDPAQFLPQQQTMSPNMQYAQQGAQVKNPEPPRPDELKPYIDQGIITWDEGKGTYRVALTDKQLSKADRFNLLETLTPILNQYGYKNIVQSGASKTGSPYSNFYAGFTPQDYEYKIVERNLGKEEADKLNELELRKKAYDIMGFKTNADISNANIYNDPKFFGEFQRAFYRYLPKDTFRGDLGNDIKFGFEHYDAIPKRIPNKPNQPGRPEIPVREIPPPVPRQPIGFYPQDVLNAAAAVGDLASINKYMPRMTQFSPVPMKPTFYDPNRELAANAEMANIAAQNLAQFTGPQAFNARFSDVQGKGLANAANILGRYNNLNVGVANQFEQANKQLINEANFRNALAANDFYDKSVIANQQYDNARRQARRENIDYINAALENRFMTEQMNSLYPNYYVEPSRLKTYYTPGRQITPAQQANNMMTYLEATGIPFDFTNPQVQAQLLKGMMGDVSTDERGNIFATQSGMSQRRKGKS